MTNLLADLYPWTKALHIMAVMSWMAGLFYFPRLLVYHTEQDDPSGVLHETFQVMERRLFKAIMTPAMIATWIFGLALVFTPGIVDWSDAWPWVKGACVISMSAFHDWLGRRRIDFVKERNQLTGRQYRLMNEVPTLLMVLIVISVVVKY
jgi:putative membrane protein